MLVVVSNRRNKWQSLPEPKLVISHWSKQYGHSLNPNMPRVSFCSKRVTKKKEAIVECVATGPRIHGSAWEKQKVVEKAFIDAGFINRVTKTCPDIYQMMSMCGIDFDKNRLRRESFIDNLETVIAEHVRSGYVSEEFFDSLGVAVDIDAHGREYPLLPHTGHCQRRPDSVWVCRAGTRKKMERTPERTLPPD
jgi:hypothetical protein